MNIRHRIKGHRRLRAGELVPHELNCRLHPERQRAALQALYEEIGFARSLLAYELPDGRLKLIDGHLRRELDPDLEVEVEVLDVTEEEARKLLLSIDPLAALAETDAAIYDQLQQLTQTDSAALNDLWNATRQACQQTRELLDQAPRTSPEQFLILIECRDEEEQRTLLARFHEEGLPCRALLS